MTTLTARYLTIYKTFFIDIVSSQSFPLFIIYLIFATNCFRWKKIAGPLHFQKVPYPQYLDYFTKIISMPNMNVRKNIICARMINT